jgi:hypothetical protein
MSYFRSYDHKEEGSTPIELGEIGRVVRQLEENYDECSKCTSRGRVYSVKDGIVEHSIGLKPWLIIRSPTESGVVKIAEEFGLPL